MTDKTTGYTLADKYIYQAYSHSKNIKNSYCFFGGKTYLVKHIM